MWMWISIAIVAIVGWATLWLVCGLPWSLALVPSAFLLIFAYLLHQDADKPYKTRYNEVPSEQNRG